jgi:SecD/SecF fusion protein
MLKRNLWKVLLSLAIVAWAASELIPTKDTPFPEYARTHATAKQAEFAKLLDEAAARHKANPALTPSEFVALKQIGKERKLDLSQYFPNVNLESTLRNVEKRNDILLNELLRRSHARLQKGLDLAGGVAVTLEVDETKLSSASEHDRSEKITKAIDIIHTRINAFGVAEPIIRPVGTNRIEVQLPGLNIKDNPDVINNVKAPARLDFRVVHPTATPGPGVDTPAGYEIMINQEREGRGGEMEVEEVFVKRVPEMTGEMIKTSFARPDLYGKPEVIMQFTDAGKKRFAEVTRDIARSGQESGRLGRLAIVLDGRLYSAPTVREEINSDSAQISGGNMSDRDAINLSNILNNPLDLPLVVKEQYEVGPSLAQDAIDSGMRAAVIGTALVAAFMITFYTVGGVVAVFALGVNVIIILGTMASLGATMTLPGLAGIVLTIGMAVDANILIFERMREELAAGKSLRASNEGGFIKALTTILDAHIVQLIICAIMIWLGTGPIKGFGYTLLIGVLSTLFSVLITGHLIMELLVDSGKLKNMKMFRMLGDLHTDFVKYGKPAAIGSVALVVVSIAYVFYQGPKIYGIDFAGGDVVSLQFKQKIDTAKVRDAAKTAGVSEINPTYVSSGGRETLNIETPEGKSEVVLNALVKQFPQAGFDKVGQNHIGASIGKEIELNALKSIGVSMLVILLYIAFRFEFGFGIGAMASTLHDILMNIGIFVLFGHQFSAPMVAAILCVAGYSINETVVVFDRIREELKLNPSGNLRDVINTAIRKVFARTIMTATTTFLAALSLFLFAVKGSTLHDIAFCFLVGIVTSTFSAIFIAAQVFYWWHKGDRKHVEAHHDVAPKYEWQGTSKAAE